MLEVRRVGVGVRIVGAPPHFWGQWGPISPGCRTPNTARGCAWGGREFNFVVGICSGKIFLNKFFSSTIHFLKIRCSSKTIIKTQNSSDARALSKFWQSRICGTSWALKAQRAQPKVKSFHYDMCL